jgi:kinesin family protein 6/9
LGSASWVGQRQSKSCPLPFHLKINPNGRISLSTAEMDSKEEESTDQSGIQVFLRIRPSANPSDHIKRDDIDVNKICFQIPKQEDAIVNNSRSSYGFKFNGVLDEKTKQRDVFRTVGLPVIKNVLAGYNSTIFAFGQTGSGKTFTITGGPERYEDRGIIPRSISQLFKTMKDAVDGTTYSCYVSYLEIYNQSGYDLLTDNTVATIQDIPKVTMLEDEFGYFNFKNLSIHPVASEEEALNLLFQGDTNRAVAATEMNQNSTRSHCIFTMILERRRAGTDTVVRSKLNIVDLAGSERVSRTSSEGQTLKEAKYINSSLFFLEMVIIALHEKKKRGNVHIPYRNSMMTSVLRDSLGGNCKLFQIMILDFAVSNIGFSSHYSNFCRQ